MPSLSNIEVVHRANNLSKVAWEALERVPICASVILPILNKCAELDKIGQSPPNHHWIVVYSAPGTAALILSCTDGPMGPYPIFIVNTNVIDDADFAQCIELSALTLRHHVPIERVYSVFGPIGITRSFCDVWTEITGVQPEVEPYYDAKISFLRRHAGLQRSITISESMYEVGPAGPTDILAIAELCYQFAAGSPPFTLSKEDAHIEAEKLVSSKQVWIHKLNRKVVSIAAFTRNTRQVATITKVFTDPDCRGNRCAERLVRQLSNSLLQDKGREAVVLFVGCENRAARVYHRVGFHGLDKIANGSAVDDVDRWLEIGFDRQKITLGHW